MIYNQLWSGGVRALLDYDNSIFDNFALPDSIAIDDVVDHILFKYGDCPLHAPDPEIFKFYIGRWSKRRISLWERFIEAVNAEYNPIENYDRQEEEIINFGKIVKNAGSITDTTSGEIIDTPQGQIKIEKDTITENQISADNSSTYQPDNKSIVDDEQNTSYNNYSETRNFNGYEENRALNTSESNSGNDTKISRIHGNIGVTTSQQMLNQEIDIIKRLDIIDFIADDWHDEFCLKIYI